MTILAVRITRDGKELFSTGKVYELPFLKAAVIGLALKYEAPPESCNNIGWLPIRDLVNELSLLNLPQKRLLETLWWLEKKSYLDLAHWQRYDGKLYKDYPVGMIRMCEDCNDPDCNHIGRRLIYNNGRLVKRW